MIWLCLIPVLVVLLGGIALLWCEITSQSAAVYPPCPIEWPECSPDGCPRCGGQGFIDPRRKS